MKLSENFSLDEFTKSQTALRNDIDNTPNKTQLNNLKALCTHILQPVRDYYLKPVIISSGFRCTDLNKIINGSPSSQHTEGKAADIEIWGVKNDELSDWIHTHCKYDQLILEFYDGVNPNSGWVHVSYTDGENRYQYKQATRNEKGKVVYTLR